MVCYVAVFGNSWLISLLMESRTRYKSQVEAWHLVCDIGYLQQQKSGIASYQCGWLVLTDTRLTPKIPSAAETPNR